MTVDTNNDWNIYSLRQNKVNLIKSISLIAVVFNLENLIFIYLFNHLLIIVFMFVYMWKITLLKKLTPEDIKKSPFYEVNE